MRLKWRGWCSFCIRLRDGCKTTVESIDVNSNLVWNWKSPRSSWERSLPKQTVLNLEESMTKLNVTLHSEHLHNLLTDEGEGLKIWSSRSWTRFWESRCPSIWGRIVLDAIPRPAISSYQGTQHGGHSPDPVFLGCVKKTKNRPSSDGKRPCPDIGIGYKSNGHKENPANTIRPLPIKSFSRHYHRRRLPALCEGQDLLLVRRKRFFYIFSRNRPESGKLSVFFTTVHDFSIFFWSFKESPNPIES